MTKRRLAFLAFAVFDLLLLAVVVGLFLVRSQQDDLGRFAQLGMAELAEPTELREFALTDQYGEPFSRADFSGNWDFLFFGFTSCPDICPLSMQALEGFYRELEARGLEQDVDVVMVSVDPLRDTPAVMGDFVASFHPDFVGLTGEYPEIAGLAEQLFFAFASPDEHGGAHGAEDYVVQHSDYIAIIDPRGRYRNIVHAPHNTQRLLQIFETLPRD